MKKPWWLILALTAAMLFIAACGGDDKSTVAAQVPATATPTTATKADDATATPTKPQSSPTATPTTAPVGTPTPAPKQKVTSNFDLPAQKGTFEHNTWKVTTYNGVTDQMIGWFQNPVLKQLAPQLWPTFPNVPNPLVPDFRVVDCTTLDKNAKPGSLCVPDGMYYGLDERNQCPQDLCAAIVPARGYLEVTGDWDLGFASHYAVTDKLGSALLIINVGNVTADFEDVRLVHAFTLEGRYFNGETLHWGIWSITSHAAAAMLNYPVYIPDPNDPTGNRKVLSAGDSPDDVNAGSNCSVPEGCKGIHSTVIITSGNQVLLVATTIFNKP